MTCNINNERLLCRSTKAHENVDFNFHHADGSSEKLGTCVWLNGRHECFDTKGVNITISDENVTEAFMPVPKSFVKKAGQFVCQTGDLTIPCTWLPQASHDPNILTSITTEGFNKTTDYHGTERPPEAQNHDVYIAVGVVCGVVLICAIGIWLYKRYKDAVKTSACIKKKDTTTKGSCSDECSNRQEDLPSEDHGDAVAGQEYSSNDSSCDAVLTPLLTTGLSVNQTTHDAASDYVQITLVNDESLPTSDDHCIQNGKKISNEDSSSASSFSVRMKNPSLFVAEDMISSGSVSRGKSRGAEKLLVHQKPSMDSTKSPSNQSYLQYNPVYSKQGKFSQRGIPDKEKVLKNDAFRSCNV